MSVDFFNSFLELKFFNIFFTLFCFAILINGSNFLDGLNGLLSGYYLIVLGSLLYLNFSNEEIGLSQYELINLFFISFNVFFTKHFLE